MDDALFVRGGEPAGDLQGVVDRFADGQGRSIQFVTQGRALEQFHDHEAHRGVRASTPGGAVGNLHVMNDDNVRVAQRAGSPRLLFEAPEPFGIVRERRGQDLDRDVTAEPWIVRTVDRTHPAGADRADDGVVPEARARRETHTEP